MIKVLYLIDTLVIGGAEKSLIEISTRFQNVQPIFIQIYKGDDQSNLLKTAGIMVFALNISEKYGFDKAVRSIIPIVNKIKPDIIHSTLFRSDIIARKLKSKTGIPLINSFVSNSYSRKRYSNLNWDKKLKLKVIQIYDRSTASQVDLFISNSHIIKKENAYALKIDEKRIVVIPRGRSVENFSSTTCDIHNFKTKLGLENKKIFLNVGRLIQSKGQLDLIRAFAEVKEEIPDSVLLIAGEGCYRNILEKEISKLSLSNEVFLLGSRNDIPQLLEISDIFIFPTYLEGMPGSLIEAMFAKIDIISSDIPENRECLPDYFKSFFTPGDIKKLKCLMIERIKKERNSNEVSREIYKYAIDNYEINNIATQYETVYQDLLR